MSFRRALLLNVQCGISVASMCIFIIIIFLWKQNGCHTFFDILWLEDATKTHFCTFAIAEATFSTHHGHCYVFGSVSSQPKASKFSEKCQGRSTFLASLPQWVGHSQRLMHSTGAHAKFTGSLHTLQLTMSQSVEDYLKNEELKGSGQKGT